MPRRATIPAVVGGGAQNDSRSGELEHRPQGDEDEHPHRHHGELVGREVHAARDDRPREGVGEHDGHVVEPPEELGQIPDDEHRGEGQHELHQLLGVVHPAQEHDLEGEPDEGDEHPANENAREEPARGAGRDPGMDLVGKERPQHVERAVGEVDDARYPEDEGQAGGDEEEEHSLHQPLKDLDDDHARVPRQGVGGRTGPGPFRRTGPERSSPPRAVPVPGSSPWRPLRGVPSRSPRRGG